MKLEALLELTENVSTIRKETLVPMRASLGLVLKPNMFTMIDITCVSSSKIPVAKRVEYRVGLERYECELLRWEATVKAICLMRGEVGCNELRVVTVKLNAILNKLKKRL